MVLDKPPLKISGMLERRTGSEVAPGLTEQITGLIAVETGFFALQAMGFYAKSLDGWSSMFLFGEIAATGERGLFGPPPFTVVAISLGFGVNSTVRMPTIDDVGTFPLVQRLAGASEASPEDVLEKLAGEGGWITPKADQYWGAGGLEFTSFRFLQARVRCGRRRSDGKVSVGRATVDLPRSKDAKAPLARVVADLAIGYQGAQKLFFMDVVIAPGSYVLDPAAELSGGLPLYIWGETRGSDGGGKGFVFTIGGYHKKFPVPKHYPTPPRVGWQWARGPVMIRGQLYAALNDGMFMAGGELSATYDKGHGIQLQAWFTAWVDVLVQWKPFYFELSMGMSIGVAATVKVLFVRVRISLSVGVGLELWGPPIGGWVTVKVWFISFTIDFGSGRDTAPSIGWDEFRMQLPAPLAIVPQRGLLVDVDPAETAARAAAGEPLLVSMVGFTFSTEAALPASRITLDGKTLDGGTADLVDIRPMRRTGLVAEHKVVIERFGDPDFDAKAAGWKVEPLVRDLPRALWGKPLSRPGDALTQDGVVSCLVGVRFEVPPLRRYGQLGPVTSEALKAVRLDPCGIPLRDANADGPAPEENDRSIAAITNTSTGIAASATAERRSGVHAALAAFGLAPDSDGPLTEYAVIADSTFTDAPMTTTAR